MEGTHDFAALRRNYEEITGRIRAAEALAGRAPGSVALIPAVKYADAEQIDFLVGECGLRDIGENRVQTMLEHLDGMKNEDRVNVHFIGSLQKNKVKYVVGRVKMIHSLDSYGLAEEIEKQAAKRGICVDVLVEINSGEEESKGGVLPEDAGGLCGEIAALPHLCLRGFMTMGPKCEKKDDYYKYFIKTYNLVLDIWQKKLHNIGEPVLSMGMTDSLEPAVAAGSTCVRIGRAIFGGNPAPKQ